MLMARVFIQLGVRGCKVYWLDEISKNKNILNTVCYLVENLLLNKTFVWPCYAH